MYTERVSRFLSSVLKTTENEEAPLTEVNTVVVADNVASRTAQRRAQDVQIEAKVLVAVVARNDRALLVSVVSVVVDRARALRDHVSGQPAAERRAEHREDKLLNRRLVGEASMKRSFSCVRI